MIINKFIRDVEKKDKNGNPYRISNKKAKAARPTEVPLQFRNLKANTKYKIFLQNNDGSLQEDITRFSKPFGKSIVENNNTSLFDDLVSTSSGELFVKAKPFGTDNVSLSNDDWNNHWKYAKNKTKDSDVGRQNFIVVESASVSFTNIEDKTKTLPDRIFPITLDVDRDDEKLQRKIKQQFRFDYIQTFFVDPNSVGNAKTVDLTDVTLYFRNKPDRELNKSKRIDPGVRIALIDIDNDKPNVEKQYSDSITDVAWSFVQATADASAGTRFQFRSPVRVEPGRYYGVAVMFDDKDYVLWSSKRGDILVNTELQSPGSSKGHRGTLYERTNAISTLRNTNFDDVFTKKTDTDLKFDVHVAEYDLSSDVSLQLVNIDQEFLVISNTDDKWVGSEYVYEANTANVAGSFAITAGTTELVGTSTTFTSDLAKGSTIVLIQGSNTQVLTIGSVITDTLALVSSDVPYTMATANCKVTAVGKVDYYDYDSKLLYLRESTANSTVYFENGDTIKGIESGEEAVITKVGAFPVTVFNSDLDVSLPSNYTLSGSYKLSTQDSVNALSFSLYSSNTDLDFFKPNYVREYEGLVVSRSLEARNEATMYDQDGDAATSDGKSVRFNLDFAYQGTGSTTYEAPLIDISRTGLSVKQWSINNDTTNEHTNSGNALTRHISTKLVLDEGQEAEDIRVIQNAFRPIGTDIKMYAKILNIADPDPFDDKNWTELSRISGNTIFSEKGNLEDYREYIYTFPSTIPSDTTLTGTATTSSNSATVTGVGTSFSNTLIGSVIKIYSEFFEDNYGYFSVVDVANTTSLTVNEPITNTDIIGSGFKIDSVTTPQTAFLNPLNNNIVRYFGASGEVYDGYSTLAIKTVLLSEDGLVTPRVDDNRVISVSA